MTLHSKDTENILGYPVTILGIEACIERISSWIHEGTKPRYFVCANSHSLVLADKDDTFQHAIKEADLIVPDGSGIVLASKILGGSIKRVITGSDLFRELNKTMNRTGGYSCFFLGSTKTTLTQICNKMKTEYPDVLIAGTFSPPYKPEFSKNEIDEMIDVINQRQPDVLWVGMTAPKQEKWIYWNKTRLNVKCIGPVGAVFDFYTGNVKRSHPVFLKYGLEWLPRLLREPKRLWRRSLISAPKFIFSVLKQKWNH